ncbi:hypothetical protein CW304_00970 [Bacillus sp. UFRGS-B20]|nr:hypothetical protein CW304_00970 [Bacillus sp. UFRGS-B20]
MIPLNLYKIIYRRICRFVDSFLILSKSSFSRTFYYPTIDFLYVFWFEKSQELQTNTIPKFGYSQRAFSRFPLVFSNGSKFYVFLFSGQLQTSF